MANEIFTDPTSEYSKAMAKVFAKELDFMILHPRLAKIRSIFRWWISGMWLCKLGIHKWFHPVYAMNPYLECHWLRCHRCRKEIGK